MSQNFSKRTSPPLVVIKSPMRVPAHSTHGGPVEERKLHSEEMDNWKITDYYCSKCGCRKIQLIVMTERRKRTVQWICSSQCRKNFEDKKQQLKERHEIKKVKRISAFWKNEDIKCRNCGAFLQTKEEELWERWRCPNGCLRAPTIFDG